MNYDIWPKVSKGLSQPTDLFQSPHGDLVQESQPWTSVSRCPRCLSPRRCDAWWWFHFGDGTTQIFYSYTVCVYSMYVYILYYIYTGWWWLEPWNFEWLPFSWECHHPKWRSPSFFRGVGLKPPTRWWLKQKMELIMTGPGIWHGICQLCLDVYWIISSV